MDDTDNDIKDPVEYRPFLPLAKSAPQPVFRYPLGEKSSDAGIQAQVDPVRLVTVEVCPPSAFLTSAPDFI